MLADISNYKNNTDWLYIASAVILCDALFIVFYKSKNINKWYANFGLLAVIADVLSILIGMYIVRVIYTKLKLTWSPIKFIMLCLAVQIIHDVLYYFLLVSPFPLGNNGIIDFMKVYGREGGIWTILGDSLLVTIMVILSMYLASLPGYMSIAILMISLYIIPYAISPAYEP